MSNSSEINLTQVGGFGRGKSERFSSNTIMPGSDAGCDMRFDPVWAVLTTRS